jgi:hypothetical protein
MGAICFTHEHEARQLMLHLFRALGKFVQPEAAFYEEARALVLHAAQAEFQAPDAVLPTTSPKDHEVSQVNLVHALLFVLAYDIPARPENELVMSVLFRDLVLPLLPCPFKVLQTLAAKFLHAWPAPRDGFSTHAAIRLLQAGLAAAQALVPLPAAAWQEQQGALAARLLHEDGRVALRTSCLRQLLQPPGTHVTLEGVPEEPGVFVNLDAGLLHTSATALHLPVHPASRVTMYRVVPAIPGVPDGCTTTPLIFSVGSWPSALSLASPSCLFAARAHSHPPPPGHLASRLKGSPSPPNPCGTLPRAMGSPSSRKG